MHFPRIKEHAHLKKWVSIHREIYYDTDGKLHVVEYKCLQNKMFGSHDMLMNIQYGEIAVQWV